MEQRDGEDLLTRRNHDSERTPGANRGVDIKCIVTDLNLSQTGTGGFTPSGGTTATGGGAIGSSIQPTTEAFELGPVLDVVPSISADGYTVQMTLIPTLKEFLGYDDPGQFVAQIQSASGSTGGSTPLLAPTPLPKFRLRQVATSVVVWDGQTVVLGGLISEDVTKVKDRVPVLGDLPLLGRFFQSESSVTSKKNLVIFVTPTIIDPSGNRLHLDADMPFAQNSIPVQPGNVVVPTATTPAASTPATPNP